jgi:hypothetical protein
MAKHEVKHQPAYEVNNVSICPKTGNHLLEVKITGKSQSTHYLAEEIVVDNNFLLSFSSSDIRTITYLATSDRYETILREEKIKKSYEIIRGRSNKGNKQIQIKNKLTNEIRVISLCAFNDPELIDSLNSQDAYHLGYLAGQEQTWKDCVRLKIISKERNAVDE